jgi:hypothetical protein
MKNFSVDLFSLIQNQFISTVMELTFSSLHSLTKNKIIFFFIHRQKKRDSNVLGNVHVIAIHLLVAPDVIVADVTIFILNDTSGLLKVNQ